MSYPLAVILFWIPLLTQESTEEPPDTKTQSIEVDFSVRKDQRLVPLEDCWVWLPHSEKMNADLDSIRYSWPVSPAKVIEKRGKQLIPPNLVLRSNQPFIFFNSSKNGWSPKLLSIENEFSMQIRPGNTEVFTLKSTHIPRRLSDDSDHEVTSMSILVVDHPFAYTADNGKAVARFPDGEWFLRAWQAELGHPDFVTINGSTRESWAQFRKRTLTISNDLKHIHFEWNAEN